MGRPIIKTQCGSLSVGTKYGAKTKLITSASLACQSTGVNNNNGNPTTDGESSWSTAKIVLVVLVGILLVGILGVGGYFGFQKYQEMKDTDEFMRVPNATDDMASVALNQSHSDVEDDSE